GNQSAERNLKGQGTDINRIVSACAWMQIDAIASDADGVRELRRFDISAFLAGFLHTIVRGNLLLDDSEFRPDAAALANVRILRQPVFSAANVRRSRIPFQPVPPSGRGASVCSQ